MPHRIADIIDIVDSAIAWPSGTFAAVNAPAQRSGRPSRRQLADDQRPIAGSGVPNVGAPDRSAIDDRKLP